MILLKKMTKKNTYSMHRRYLKCALTFKINFSQLVSELKGSRSMGEENKQPFADIETNQQMTVGKINLAPYPAKNFCEWLQEQAIKKQNQ